MKIGILTFHNAHNYGAVMQAYALRAVLRGMGHDAVILNYRNPAIESSYLKKRNIRYGQADWNIQCDKFNQFIDTVLLEGNTAELGWMDLEEAEVDCFICGSDQIWTAGLTAGLDKAYFLDFITDAKKISYAASKFDSKIAYCEKEYFVETLSAFHAVSVREENLAEELMHECHIEAETVLDPALLLHAEDYACLQESVKETDKFVLAYYVCEDKRLGRCARRASGLLKLSLIEIHFYRQEDESGYQIADCGPGEFLTYFHRAEYILTNSYHGVIFSVIYQKPFYAVYQHDSRKDCLLKKLGLRQRHIHTEEEVKCGGMESLWAAASVKLQKERNVSMAFLENSING